MPFEPFVTGVIETTINKCIEQDSHHQTTLARLKGKVIQVQILDNRLLSKLPLIFIFSQQVDVLNTYEGKIDCHLKVTLDALKQMKNPSKLTDLIKQEKLIVEGDLTLAQQFSELLTEIMPDPEELLSKVTGDVVAHTVVDGAKQQWQWLNKEFKRQKSHLATAVTQEWRIAPNSLEVADFCNQVDEAHSQISSLEQRLNTLASDEPLQEQSQVESN